MSTETNRRPLLDWLLSKTVSKKLTAFIIATVALFGGFIDGENWTMITGLYIFGLTFLNFMKLKKG